MGRKIAVIHTTAVTYDKINSLIRQMIPGAEVMNIVDDSLLNDVRANGGLTPRVARRLAAYAVLAEESGAEVILNACSSVGEAVDPIRRLLTVPFLKIDQPMARQAVESGERIAVFGTVKTTLEPSVRLIESTAGELGKAVRVDSYLAPEAFDALSVEKDQDKHNRILLELIQKVEADYDVLVLAQASMSVLLPRLEKLGKPVLGSMESGVAGVRERLEQTGRGSA